MNVEIQAEGRVVLARDRDGDVAYFVQGPDGYVWMEAEAGGHPFDPDTAEQLAHALLDLAKKAREGRT